MNAICSRITMTALAIAAAIVTPTRVCASQVAPVRAALAAPASRVVAPWRVDSVPKPTDRWIARDKGQHFLVSAVIELAAYGVFHALHASCTESLVGASMITSAMGIGKEVHDARGHGNPSWRDLAWDGIGLAAGAGVVTIASRHE